MTPPPDPVRRAEAALRAAGESARADQIAEALAACDRPELLVAVFGEFSRGKSTLINALLGRVVLPAKLVPTTGHVTRIVAGPADEVRVRIADGRVETCALDQLDSLVCLNPGRVGDELESVEVAVAGAPLLDRLVILDTPGVGEARLQTDRTRRALAEADLVLVLLDARQLLGDAERELAADWLAGRLGKAVVPVVNFLNFVPEERDRDELRARLERWTSRRLPAQLGRPWFEVNALGALRHVLGCGKPTGDDFEALRAELTNMNGEERRRFQERGRTGRVRVLLEEAIEENAVALRRGREELERFGREWLRLRETLADELRRFGAEAAARRERLVRFAEQMFAQAGEVLAKKVRSATKEEVEREARQWLRAALAETARFVEQEADGALAALAGERLNRPQPASFGIAAPVPEPLPEGNSPAAERSFWDSSAEVIDSIRGTVRGWWARWSGQEEADSADAGARLRRQWEAESQPILASLQAQYDERAAALKRELEGWLAQTDPARQPIADEVRRREALEAELRAALPGERPA